MTQTVTNSKPTSFGRTPIRVPGRIFRGTLALSAAVAAMTLAGCNVGPKYTRAAAAPPPPAYKESVPATYANLPDGSWKPAQPSDAMLKGKWWEVFQDSELNALEEQLNINNQTVQQYFQNFMASRALVNEARASFFPTLTTAPSWTRTRAPSTLRNVTTSSSGTTTATTSASGTTSSVLSLPFDASWSPDLWGRVRNQVKEYQFAAQVSAADLENERLTEQASLAIYYFQLRGQDALQDVYDRTVDADRKSYDLTKALYETGIDSEESVAQSEVTLDNAIEARTGVATNRAIYEHAIATLIGKPAGSFSMPIKALDATAPPIPIGMPSQLLERRPDIAAAERTMAQANALIGVEKAAFYPTISLTGGGGLEASHITSLFSAPAFFWSLGSSASETIFDAGLRHSTMQQYTAQYNSDVASYRETVLTAFQQVEDYIATLRTTSAQSILQDTSIKAAKRYVELANARYETGVDPYINVLSAETTLLSDQTTQVQLKINQMTAAVELIQALGGGWDSSQLPAATTITSAAAADKVKNTP